MVGGEGDDKAIADLVPQLEAETGIELEVEAPQLGPLIEKTFQIIKSDHAPFELISYLGSSQPNLSALVVSSNSTALLTTPMRRLPIGISPISSRRPLKMSAYSI